MSILALLWSINEQMGGRDGYEMADPSREWLSDLAWLKRRDDEIKQERKLALLGTEDEDDG